METAEEKDADFKDFDTPPQPSSLTNTIQYKCHFPFDYLKPFKDVNDYSEAEEKLTDLLLNLNKNKYCKKLGTASVFFTRILK